MIFHLIKLPKIYSQLDFPQPELTFITSFVGIGIVLLTQHVDFVLVVDGVVDGHIVCGGARVVGVDGEEVWHSLLLALLPVHQLGGWVWVARVIHKAVTVATAIAITGLQAVGVGADRNQGNLQQ